MSEPAQRLCAVPNCGNRHHAHGFCSTHRERFLRHGDPLGGRVRNAPTLEVDENLRRERSQQALCEECGEPEYSRGFCRPHYHRRRRRGLLRDAPFYGQGADRPAQPRREQQAIDPAKSDGHLFLKEALAVVTSDCVEWPFYKLARGYGRLGDGKSAHRAMCIMAHGAPPFDGAQAAHNCGNASCVNPAHLRWATAKENEEDKYRHGTRRRRAA